MAKSNRLKCVLLIFVFMADSFGLPQMKPYEFAYSVNDNLSGNDFGHRESSDGQVVQGQYYVLLPDGQRQTVTYTADAVNGYQAKVAVRAPTYEDSIQQLFNQHLEYNSQGNESEFVKLEELRNAVERFTDEQETDRSRLLIDCTGQMKNRYSECLARCTNLDCWNVEFRNFLSACLSSTLQTCTAPTTSSTTTTTTTKKPVVIVIGR